MVVTHSQIRNNACLIRCDGCLSDVSASVWIQCVSCQIDICYSCFSQKLEINGHEYGHPYCITKNLQFRAEGMEWEMLEELLFIDGLIVYGLGNWDELAQYVGQSQDKIKHHFVKTYLTKDTDDLEGPPATEAQSNPLSAEIAGYMPLREDFEIEHNNDAELVLKEMSFSPSDTQLEREMKEALLDSFRRTLECRRLFRRLVLSKGLLAAKKKIDAEKALCPPGRDLLARLKPLLKFLNPPDFNVLFQSMYLEALIRKKISAMLRPRAPRSANAHVKKQCVQGEEEKEAQTLLSKTERMFCRSNELPQKVYSVLKEAAIISQITTGAPSKKSMARAAHGLEEAKILAALDFFARNKWIDPQHKTQLQEQTHFAA